MDHPTDEEWERAQRGIDHHVERIEAANASLRGEVAQLREALEKINQRCTDVRLGAPCDTLAWGVRSIAAAALSMEVAR